MSASVADGGSYYACVGANVPKERAITSTPNREPRNGSPANWFFNIMMTSSLLLMRFTNIPVRVGCCQYAVRASFKFSARTAAGALAESWRSSPPWLRPGVGRVRYRGLISTVISKNPRSERMEGHACT